jgi:hypothetical protein
MDETFNVNCKLVSESAVHDAVMVGATLHTIEDTLPYAIQDGEVELSAYIAW